MSQYHLFYRSLCGVGQALEILQLFPNIREYSLILLTSCYDNIPLPISPLNLIHLETLLVDTIDPMILDDLLLNIDAPSLKNFTYHGRDFSISYDTIITFLNHSGCLLNVFSLRYTSINEIDIILLLVAMPSLETLILGLLSMDGITSVCQYDESITDRMLDILSDTVDLSLHPHFSLTSNCWSILVSFHSHGKRFLWYLEKEGPNKIPLTVLLLINSHSIVSSWSYILCI